MIADHEQVEQGGMLHQPPKAEGVEGWFLGQPRERLSAATFQQRAGLSLIKSILLATSELDKA